MHLRLSVHTRYTCALSLRSVLMCQCQGKCKQRTSLRPADYAAGGAVLACLMQVGAAVKADRANLQLMLEAGGFQRITQLVLWTALTFGTGTQPVLVAPSAFAATPHGPPGFEQPEAATAIDLTPVDSAEARALVGTHSPAGGQHRGGGHKRPHSARGHQEGPAACPHLEVLFAVLSSWLALREDRQKLPHFKEARWET